MEFGIHGRFTGTVKQYPYRTAIVLNVFASTPRNEAIKLEHQLAEAAGAALDNHTVYEVATLDGKNKTYIWFSDLSVHFGLSLIEKRW